MIRTWIKWFFSTKIETTAYNRTGIDAIFGGHAHEDATHLYGSVPALATLNYGQAVAHIALKFNKSTKEFAGIETGYGIEVLETVASGLQDNSDINSIMDQYAPEINKIKHIKLATADATLKFDGALKNICTSAMFETAVASAKVNNPDINTDKIVAAFHNVNGGIRADIEKGDVTYGDVYKSFPFDNEVVLVKVTGSQCRANLTALNKLGCYRVFEKSDYFAAGDEYYIATTDYLAFSDSSGFSTLLGKTLDDSDLIRTGKVVRDEIANKVYQLDNLKNADLLYKGDYHYAAIPMTF